MSFSSARDRIGQTRSALQFFSPARQKAGYRGMRIKAEPFALELECVVFMLCLEKRSALASSGRHAQGQGALRGAKVLGVVGFERHWRGSD